MYQARPKLFNDTFSKLFDKKASMDLKHLKLPEKIQSLKELTQYIILDYKFNRNKEHTCEMLQRLDDRITKCSVEFSNPKMNEKDKVKLREAVDEVNGDKGLSKVRDATQNERGKLNGKTGDASRQEDVSDKENLPPNQGRNDEGTRNISGEEKKIDEEMVKEKEMNASVKPEVNRPACSQGDISSSPEKENRDPQDFSRMVEKMRDLFNDHQLEEAYELKERLLRWERETDEKDENKEIFGRYLQESQRIIQEIDIWHQQLQDVLSKLNDEEGFIVDTGVKDYSLKYKELPDGRIMLKLEGSLKIPLFNILAIMYEVDYFPQWVPFCNGSKLVQNLHKGSRAFWLKYSLPPPFTPRECHCFGYGADRLYRNGSILLMSKSIDFDENMLNHYDIKVPKESKFIKMDSHIAVEVVPVSQDEILTRQIIITDPKIKNLPQAFLNWMNRKTGQHVFEIMVKKAKNFKGTCWEKVIQENPQFYGWLGQKVDVFLKEHDLVENMTNLNPAI